MNGPQLRNRIETLYVFLVVDPRTGDDVGILESRGRGEIVPFIFSDYETAEMKFPLAEQLSRKSKNSFRVVKFRGVEDCTQTRT